MAFNIKDFVTGLAVKRKATPDGTNGEVTHQIIDAGTVELGAATLAALENVAVTGPITDAQARATPLPVAPFLTTGANLVAQTAAAGGSWTAFGAQACRQLTIANNTGTVIEFDQDLVGAAFPIPSGSAFTIYGIANASQIRVRRVDQSNTQVTVAARGEG